jgi:hypothetical protein
MKFRRHFSGSLGALDFPARRAATKFNRSNLLFGYEVDPSIG